MGIASQSCNQHAGVERLHGVSRVHHPILHTGLARRCLRKAICTVRSDWPLSRIAIALLPDHIHAIWTLPPADARYPIRWKRIKEEFTRRYLEAGGHENPPSVSRLRHDERGIWQRRYWEHTIRDEEDLKRCVDYVHWNLKKHGHVKSVRDWPWSSFHRFVSLAEYTLDCGAEDPTPGYDAPEWGE
jgi:putative transposase